MMKTNYFVVCLNVERQCAVLPAGDPAGSLIFKLPVVKESFEIVTSINILKLHNA